MKSLFTYLMKGFNNIAGDYIPYFSVECFDNQSIICKRYNLDKSHFPNGVYEESFLLSKNTILAIEKIITEIEEDFTNTPESIDNLTRDTGVLSSFTINNHTVEIDIIVSAESEIKQSQKDNIDVSSNLLVSKIMKKIQDALLKDGFSLSYTNYLYLKYDELGMDPVEYCIKRCNIYMCYDYINELVRYLWTSNCDIYPLVHEKDDDCLFMVKRKSGNYSTFASTKPSLYLQEKTQNKTRLKLNLYTDKYGYEYRARKKFSFRSYIEKLMSLHNIEVLVLNYKTDLELYLNFTRIVKYLKSIAPGLEDHTVTNESNKA